MQKIYYDAKYYDSELEKEVDFQYCTELNLQEKVDFINGVLQVLFQNNYYYSILKQKVFDFMLINFFTNVIKNEEEFDLTLIKMDDIVINTTIIDVIYDKVDKNLIQELYDAIEVNIEYKTGIHKDELSTTFSNLLKELNDKVSNLDIENLVSSLSKLGDISNNATLDKILDAYTKTDAYKKNYQKTVRNKNKQIRELKEKVNETK